jgi:hypothetical protein
MKYLYEALKINTSITTLDLSCNNIKDELKSKEFKNRIKFY